MFLSIIKISFYDIMNLIERRYNDWLQLFLLFFNKLKRKINPNVRGVSDKIS